ncbi:energy transducer TonB [Hymenobacter sp. B1770]|uniref:energy transducer TonB n=1 Tax=Hymenobacter sp. B1770 TaxID=1718788 RepID=UPI003CE8BB85
MTSSKMLLSSLFVVVLTFPALAQQAGTPPKAIYTYIDQPPLLPGNDGIGAISKAVQQQLAYPPQALRDGMVGKVFVDVTVAKEGSVYEAKVVCGLRPDCDSAAVAAVQRLPQLSPPRFNGWPVYYSFTLPVVFQAPVPSGK